MQMYYDSVEVGGILASKSDGDIFTKTLLQVGLGDSVVTTIATEILARNYNASVFPNNPHTIYDLPTISDDANASIVHSLYTEMLYEREVQMLLLEDMSSVNNPVHFCFRQDPDVLRQLAEFINTGKFINVCPPEGCVRPNSECY